MDRQWPFPFLGHGVWDTDDYLKEMGCVFWFAAPVEPEHQNSVVNVIPRILARLRTWAGPFLRVRSASGFENDVWRKFGGDDEDEDDEEYELTADQAAAFCAELDNAVLQINTTHPIILVSSTLNVPHDPWHRWSVSQLPSIVARLTTFFDGSSPAHTPPTEFSPEREAAALVLGVAAHQLDRAADLGLTDPTNRALARLCQLASGYHELTDASLKRYLRLLQSVGQS